jgi:putative SOS response-associated peptidase YedK
MCNHYANDLKKLGMFLGGILGEQFSETKIPVRFGNLPEQIYPDKPGLVLRTQGDGYGLDTMRWGFPKVANQWVTNARHVVNKGGAPAPFWAEWTEHEYRCLVPATSFFEYDERTRGQGPMKEVEFARADGQPFFFAGIWRPWRGMRGTKKDPVEGDHEIYTFLTTAPNATVKPIHPKAMPVLLTFDDAEVWLNEPIADALSLQRPAPDDLLVIVETETPPPEKSTL